MSTVLVDAVQIMANIVRDPDYDILSADDYQRRLLPYVRPGAGQGFTFQQAGTGFWNHTAAAYPLALWSPSFTGQGGASYILNCGSEDVGGGPSLELTAGTDTNTSIVVTAWPIDMGQAMYGLLSWIADNRALEFAQAMSDGRSINPQTARAECMKQAQKWRGPIAFGGR